MHFAKTWSDFHWEYFDTFEFASQPCRWTGSALSICSCLNRSKTKCHFVPIQQSLFYTLCKRFIVLYLTIIGIFTNWQMGTWHIAGLRINHNTVHRLFPSLLSPEIIKCRCSICQMHANESTLHWNLTSSLVTWILPPVVIIEMAHNEAEHNGVKGKWRCVTFASALCYSAR